MGCGVSRVHAINSNTKHGSGPQNAWGQNASMDTEGHADAQVQVEHRCEQADRVTQTDNFMFDDDDLYFSLGDDCEDFDNCTGDISAAPSHDTIQPDPLLLRTPDHRCDGQDIKRQLLEDAEQKIMLFTRKIHFGVDMTPRAVATSDIGVQAGWTRNNRSTQTERSTTATRHSSGNGCVEPDDVLRALTPEAAPDLDEAVRTQSYLTRMATTDIESQTDPVSRAPAANAAGHEHHEMFSDDELSSPYAHIGKSHSDGRSALCDSIAQILDEVDSDPLPRTKSRKQRAPSAPKKVCRRETGVQTVNDLVTDEAPEYAARPPPCKKKEMIPSMAVFHEVDKIALEVPESNLGSLESLVLYLCSYCRNELQKIRMFFRWIAENITYDWKHMETKLEPDEIFHSKEGVCKDYCLLFSEMCRLAGIREKTLQGFAKGYDYRPGHQFHPGQDVTHAWNAVFIFGAWRFIDTTWGTGYTDHTGKFQKKINEHFFLTDPEILIWTHFPYDETEKNYSRWQLLDKPVSLDEYNSLPKVSPQFFQFNMRIRSKPQNPIVFRVRTELRLASHEPMRYKFKLYPADEVENGSLNNYVFCHLQEERTVGCFGVSPPTEGRYYLKIYARPEKEMRGSAAENTSSLQNIGIFLLDCLRAKKYPQPYPLNEVPWGPTQTFYDYNMRLVDHMGPVVVTWGGKRKLTIDLSEGMLFSHQLLDADGVEMDVKGMITREEKDKRVTFQIVPHRVGMFKLMIFGMPKPKTKGKWRLPLVATFLIDCKLTKLQLDDELRLAHHRPPLPEEDKDDKDKGKKGKSSTR
ncbi:kyphoscoliosis peptidase-like [Ornithodoros turicata]|uniref:kyphoscoliosis peptidase-like n=1 Tax=Ornithodoros turicata TaxID=34597 RepID=UPI00313A3C48